jgi:hypothetical protein
MECVMPKLHFAQDLQLVCALCEQEIWCDALDQPASAVYGVSTKLPNLRDRWKFSGVDLEQQYEIVRIVER